MVGESHHPERQPQPEQSKNVLLRPFEDKDLKPVTTLIRHNMRTNLSPLFPKDVVNAYLSANREEDLRHAVRSDGTEACILESSDGKINGFALIRFNPVPRRNAYGELDLRRLHVDESIQGQGLGKRLFEWIYDRARSPEINVEYVTTQASGSSRLFFEQNGWVGETVLEEMKKRDTSAIVFVARKRVSPEKIALRTKPTHIIYAGENRAKYDFLKSLSLGVDNSLTIISSAAQEDSSEDTVAAAKSKALSVASRLKYGKDATPLIMANDIRTDIINVSNASNKSRYEQVNVGKPDSQNPLPTILRNFRMLKNTARITNKPAPYIVRSATYLHSPIEPSDDSFAKDDVSVWLTQEAVEVLSTEEGIVNYRKKVYDQYEIDISQMAGGFCFPFFLDNGYIAGINGHPLDKIPKKDQVVQKAIHIALIGIDEAVVKQRLGVVKSL